MWAIITSAAEDFAMSAKEKSCSNKTKEEGSSTMYSQVGCSKDSSHVQPKSEQPTVLGCGLKVEDVEGFSEILQIKIEDVNSFGMEEEQSDQPNDLYVKVEVKTEHDIDAHLDRPAPNDAEACFLKNHPHEERLLHRSMVLHSSTYKMVLGWGKRQSTTSKAERAQRHTETQGRKEWNKYNVTLRRDASLLLNSLQSPGVELRPPW
uniref:uncharacterized protein n=1 Tax=Myxine glutinosa TaxID=7769 RepID=UPI00358E40DB